ncbi:TonB-dependent receptor domain-containing protein [Luteimonas sp. SDU101]|uniref:TonB-dependent receptor domain-containing protein n=1 Tax=Luteimonas sp. SDU101 TaxID=3422593 RepID=UPI003EB8D369
MPAVHSRTHAATASTLAFAIALTLAGTAAAQDTTTAPGADSTRTLDRIHVTGSRIKRTDIETALPVTVIQKQEIEAQGITSAEQLLQFLNVASNGPDSLAANSGIAPPGTRGNNGVSGANLRGQGADATLVLLNGRRVASHGLAGQVVDLNSIPFAAIDRVEVLRDGASAVYGTDAIGGVINFITRNDYQGVTVSVGADVTQDGGGDIYQASVLAGMGDLDTDRWNAWLAVSAKSNGILRGKDRDFANSFQPDRGLSPDTRGTPFANVFGAAGSMVGVDANPGTPVAYGMIDPATGSIVSAINLLDLPGAAGCEAGGDMMGPYDPDIWAGPASRYACAWDYGRARTIQQPVDTTQFVGRATWQISADHQAYFEVMGSDVTSTRHFEAQQITSSVNAGPTALDAYERNARTADTYDRIYDGLAAYFGTDYLVEGAPIAYRWRCEACGPRQIETSTEALRLLLGFEGTLGSWDYSAGLSRARSESSSVLGGGYYFTPALKTMLRTGVLNPFLMPGQDQSPEAYAALDAASARGLLLYRGETTMTTFDVSFSGGLGWHLGGGEVQAAFGADVRREEYEFGGPAEWTQGNAYVFGAPGDSVNYIQPVHRDVRAVFAEFYLPILDSLEVTAAGRYDDYGDFGSTSNPRLSFKWQPVDWLAFRGAYSTSFKVPDFARLLRGTSSTPYTGLDLADPAVCPGGRYNPNVAACSEQIRPDILSGGNPALIPEEADQRSIGLVLAPTENFNLSVDWWEIERTNTIRSGFSLTQMGANYDAYAASYIRGSAGTIVAIDQRAINSGGTLSRGVEIDANLMGELAGGRWQINLNGSYLDNFQVKDFANRPYSENLVGKYERYFNLPLQWKHTLSLGWASGDWTHTLTQVYRDGYEDWQPPGIANGYTPANWDPDVEEYITYNYGVSWTGIEHLKVSFGVRNLLNTDPPFTVRYLDDGDGAGWEARVADPRGRSFNLILEARFN